MKAGGENKRSGRDVEIEMMRIVTSGVPMPAWVPHVPDVVVLELECAPEQS